MPARLRNRLTKIVVIFSIVGVLALLIVLSELQGVLIPESKAVRALEAQGFTQVAIHRKNVMFIKMHGCGADDDAVFQAIATNAAGRQAEVVVCAGWPFKGATVHIK